MGRKSAVCTMGGAIIRRFALFPLMLLMLLLLPAGMVAQKAASSSKYIATYESSTNTLTFKKNVGETLPENSAWVEDKQTVATINKNLGNGPIVHIVFDKSFSTYTPTSLREFFRNLTNLETITGLEYLNTANVTNMRNMFSLCSSLTSLDVTHFNTANVKDMSYMFYRCSSLKSLDVTHFNTANVTNMNFMFSLCSSLTSLDVTHFNTANVTDMSYMFYSCSSLTSLDVTHFNTANVKDMRFMFSICKSLTSLDVTHFNTANVTDMNHMFDSCTSLTSLDVTNFNTEKVTNMAGMFYFCSSLTTIYASSKFVTTQVSNSSSMFYYCEKLKGEVDWTKDKATDKTYAKIEGGYFSSVAVRPWVKYADGTLTFYNSPKRTLGENEYGIYDGWATPDWVWQNPNVTNVTKVVFDPAFANARPTKCNEWFQNYVNLTSIEGIEYLNTSQVTDMHNMFYNCYHLQTTDFSGFDTRKVKDMRCMFYNCGSLKSLDISNFNTSEVTDMRNMFYHCIGLTSLDLSHFNTSKVSIMISMFQLCSNLLSVNLSGWDTRNVGSMDHMFEKCISLKTLDLSGFDTREKTCAMDDMFNTCKELTTIFVSDKFAVGTRGTGDGTMFLECKKLKGANDFDKNKTGIDNANYKTGYFTKLVGKNGDEKIGATGETLATDNLVLDDNKDFVAYEPFAAKAASYNRTMNAGTTWATLCLPFEVSLENQNFRAFKLLSADDVTETVELEEIEGSIEAGTPVIIKMNDGATKLNFTVADKAIANEVKTAETANGNYQLQGLYTQKEFSKDTDNNCYIVKGSKLMNPAKLLGTSTEFVGSKPFRAYMVDNSSAPAAGARMFSISVGGSTTAIEQLETTADSKAEYYDLQGRRLQNLQKGVNIVKRGGKTMKVIIK